MDRESINAAYDQAKTLVADIKGEPFQSIAFEVVFKRLLDGVGQLPVPLSDPEVPVLSQRVSNIAIGEFLAMTQAKSFPDRVVVITLYYLRARGEESVTRPDLLEAFSKARISKPRNLSDVVAQAVRKGHLMDSEPKNGQKAWKITMTGERYVEDNLLRPG